MHPPTVVHAPAYTHPGLHTATPHAHPRLQLPYTYPPTRTRLHVPAYMPVRLLTPGVNPRVKVYMNAGRTPHSTRLRPLTRMPLRKAVCHHARTAYRGAILIARAYHHQGQFGVCPRIDHDFHETVESRIPIRNREMRASSRVESSRVRSNRVESSLVESGRAKSIRVESGRVELSRVELSRVESSRVESSRVESSRLGSSRVGSSRAEPFDEAPERTPAHLSGADHHRGPEVAWSLYGRRALCDSPPPSLSSGRQGRSLMSSCG